MNTCTRLRAAVFLELIRHAAMCTIFIWQVRSSPLLSPFVHRRRKHLSRDSLSIDNYQRHLASLAHLISSCEDEGCAAHIETVCNFFPADSYEDTLRDFAWWPGESRIVARGWLLLDRRAHCRFVPLVQRVFFVSFVPLSPLFTIQRNWLIFAECPDGQLPCDNGVCINKNFFCDHNIDCHDASDERNCRKDIFR